MRTTLSEEALHLIPPCLFGCRRYLCFWTFLRPEPCWGHALTVAFNKAVQGGAPYMKGGGGGTYVLLALGFVSLRYIPKRQSTAVPARECVGYSRG